MKPESHSATTEPLAHYSLSRYSPGTSSCGTSCVRTSFWSVSPACSTPATASASNAFPSSINSATLSESAPSMLDNPCKSPDCPPLSQCFGWKGLRIHALAFSPNPCPECGRRPRTGCLLAEGLCFHRRLFQSGLLLRQFLLRSYPLLSQVLFNRLLQRRSFLPGRSLRLPELLVSFVLGHPRSLPPAHACSRNRARRIARKPTGPATQFPPLVSDAGPEATILFQLPTDHLTLRQTWHTAFNSQANDRITSGLLTILELSRGWLKSKCRSAATRRPTWRR